MDNLEGEVIGEGLATNIVCFAWRKLLEKFSILCYNNRNN